MSSPAGPPQESPSRAGGAARSATGGGPTAPPTLSVVLSFYNEADVIPELVARLRAVLGGLVDRERLRSFELVFVDDASRDASETLLRELAVGHDDIRLVSMSRNFGVSPCVMAGLAHAAGDLVVYMDADLQDPPETIPELLAVRERTGADVVHTRRRRRFGESPFKLLLTKIGYRILTSISSVPLQSEAGDFKLLSRRVVDHLVRMEEKLPFVRGLVTWVGFRQETVLYEREARASGDTKFPVLSRRVIRNFLDSALIAFSDVPLKLSFLLSGATFLFAMLYAVWVFVAKLRGGTVEGYASTLMSVLFLGGMQFLILGIFGLYLHSIFLETKRRPNWIVRDTFGFPAPTGPRPAAPPTSAPGAQGAVDPHAAPHEVASADAR